jgi:hypothetical protein
VTDDRGDGQRSRISSVERRGFITIHQKDLVILNGATPLPMRQGPATSIVVASGSHCGASDYDDEFGTTSGLPREGKTTLDEGNAARKKSTVRKK